MNFKTLSYLNKIRFLIFNPIFDLNLKSQINIEMPNVNKEEA